VKIEKINQLVLLGGGDIFYELSRWSKEEGLSLKAICSPRHAEEVIANGKSLLENLKSIGVSPLVLEKLDRAELKAFLGEDKSNFYLSLSAPWIFKQDIISNLFRDQLFNAHGTRLPKDRGGGGHSWGIMRGNRLGNALLHLIDSGVDTGDVIDYEDFIFPFSCRTPKDYFAFQHEKTFSFLRDFIKKCSIETIEVSPMRQDHRFSTYNPRLFTPISGWINWDWRVDQLERFICAFDDPYCGASTSHNGRTVHLKKVIAQYNEAKFHPFQYGVLFRKNSKWLEISCNDGELIVEEVLDKDGNNIMDKIRVGDRFLTPSENLDEAKKRMVFTVNGLKKREY
jgi:methionyl-tRNA formyltransferase